LAHKRRNDRLEIYLEKINETSLLTKEEEIELAKRIEDCIIRIEEIKNNLLSTEEEQTELTKIENNKEEARKRFISANLRLVVSIAKKYVGRSPYLTLPDLIQEGNFGLFRAVNKFDYRRGCKFSTHATWWIRQSILYALEKQSRTIRIPGFMLRKISKYQTVYQQLKNWLKREPSIDEIASNMKMNVKEVEDIKKVITGAVSLENLTSQEIERHFYRITEDDSDLSPDTNIDSLSILNILYTAIEQLPQKEREIIMDRFGLKNGNSHQLKEIAVKLGISTERVRQIIGKVLYSLSKNEKILGIQ